MPAKTGRSIRPTKGGGFNTYALRGKGDVEPPDSRSTFAKILAGLSAGKSTLAGLSEEYVRRQKGLRGRPLGRVIGRAVKEDKSFRDLTGSAFTGFVGDILFDPVTYIPGAAFAKLAVPVKAGLRVTGLAKVGRGIQEASEVIPQIRRIKEAIGKAVIPRYNLTKHNPKRILAANNEYIRKVDGGAAYLEEEINRLMVKLEPDEKMREKIFHLLEKQPVGKLDRSDPRFLKFLREFHTLNPNQKVAFHEAGKILDELELLKKKAGLLTQERIAGFLQKHGIRYVPRMQARRSTALKDLEALADAAKSGSPVAAATGSMKEIRRSIKFIQSMDEVMPAGQVEALKDFFRSSAGLRWLFKRKTKGTVEDLPQEIAANIEKDVAVVLGREQASVARAVASRKYLSKLTLFMEKKGLAVDPAVANDPDVLFKMLRRHLTPDEAMRRVREGFKPIRGTNTPLDGKWVPKSLASEFKQVHRAYTDPKFLGEFMNPFLAVQNMWKAWTLSIFGSYHSRNAISNFFNNYLSGMHVNSIQDYKAALNLQEKARKGALATTGEFMNGMSEAKFWRKAMEERIVRGGQFAGELEQAMTRGLNSKNFIARLINPATNPWSQTMYKFGGAVEDNARLAHFMFQMRKGKNVSSAVRSVNKYLFDYKYGLTQFEKKWFRDGLFPFYAWTRFNIPLQLEMIVLQPRKYTPALKAKAAWEDEYGGPQPREIYMADWLKRAFKVRLWHNKKTNDYQYFILDSWWPAADVGKLFNSERATQEVLNLWSPIMKMPIEAFFNYNLFTKRKIVEHPKQKKRIKGPLVTAGMIAGSRFGLKGALAGGAVGLGVQAVTGKKDVALPARFEHFLRTARLINETDRVLESFDRNGWLSAVIRPMVGRTYPINFEKQREFWGYTMNRRIREAKRLRSIADRKGENDNVAVLDQQIAKLEALAKEYR